MISTPGTFLDLSLTAWRKSTFSGPDNECIEVADGFPGAIPVRDSKDPGGPVLVFPTDVWAAFVAGIKAGDYPTT